MRKGCIEDIDMREDDNLSHVHGLLIGAGFSTAFWVLVIILYSVH